MHRSVLMAVLVAILALPGSGAGADPKQDLCHVRAQKDSGYKSQGPKLATQMGSVQMRLSGSVALGVSSSRGGAPSGNVTPPFAGSAATERRENDAQARYQRLYDACMDNR
ncbi:MAG: hypothetical protein ACI8R4_003913 [Paracoccaceae bacterium]|jgi:hypothetical protein